MYDKIKQQTKIKRTQLVALGFSGLSFFSLYLALAGTKYDMRNFCFKPKVLYNTPETAYCKSGETIYQALPKYLAPKDYDVPNPSVISGDAKLMIPSIGRIDKQLIRATNPLYLLWAFTSLSCAAIGFWLYAASLQRFKLDFPRYFEEIQSHTYISQMSGISDRTVANFGLESRTAYLKQEVSQIEQDLHVQRELEKNPSFADEIMFSAQLQQAEIKQNSERQAELERIQYELMLSEARKKLAENAKDTAKFEKDALKFKKPENLEDTSKASQAINDITEILKSHEDAWLYKILEFRKPLWVIGGQGSGKSTFAASVILLRWYLFGYPLELIIDAHAQVNTLESWKPFLDIWGDSLEIQGFNNDYAAINKAFQDSINRWADKMPKFKKGEIGKAQMLVDEYTNLADAEECQELAGKFAKHSLSDPRKAGEFVVCLAHMFTQTATGNKGGTGKARQEQTIQVKRKTKNGETPLPDVTIIGLPNATGDLEELSGTVPTWFRPEKIYDYFENGKALTNLDD